MSRQWTTRRATADDAPAIKGISDAGLATYSDFEPGFRPSDEWHAREPERLERGLREGELWCLVAESGGEPVAHVSIVQARTFDEPREPIPGLAHLRQLFVLPDWWGTGLAQELLAAALAEARGRAFERMRLWTPRNHARARRFYLRGGFSATGEGRRGREIPLPLMEYAIRL